MLTCVTNQTSSAVFIKKITFDRAALKNTDLFLKVSPLDNPAATGKQTVSICSLVT